MSKEMLMVVLGLWATLGFLTAIVFGRCARAAANRPGVDEAN
jgi:hypothetical protein